MEVKQNLKKIYIKAKTVVKQSRKIFLIKMEIKNEVYLFLPSRKRKETIKRKKKKEGKKRNCLKIWKDDYTEVD